VGGPGGGGYQRGGAERAEEAEEGKRGEGFNTEITDSTEKKEEGERRELFIYKRKRGSGIWGAW